MEGVPTVFVIDADPEVRATVEEWALAMNLECRTFALGQDFLAAYAGSAAGCLVLDTQIPDMCGRKMQQRLSELGITLPQVFLSADRDSPLTTELSRGGAVRCLRKPIRPLELVKAIHDALTVDRSRRIAKEQEQQGQEGLTEVE